MMQSCFLGVVIVLDCGGIAGKWPTRLCGRLACAADSLVAYLGLVELLSGERARDSLRVEEAPKGPKAGVNKGI